MSVNSTITIDQFVAVDLRVGAVVFANAVDGSDRLIRLTVDVGEGAPRTILSGIRAQYIPEDLVGRRCIVVANLQSRVMMGVESNGMLLCVSYSGADGEVVRIVEPSAETPIGSRLS